MQAHLTRPDSERVRALAVGGLLVAVGLVAFAMQRTGVEFRDWLDGSGWTLFIIVPGAALLVAAALAAGGAAQGLTTAGAIVSTVGLLLLYQDRTGHYESWAYAWALIPMSVGASLMVHGVRVARRDLITFGARMIAIMGAILVVGAWYFETVFKTGQVPFDLGEAWPLILVAVGALVLLSTLFRSTTKEEIQR
jgi:hypothetical protein